MHRKLICLLYLALSLTFSSTASAQTYGVIHHFTGGGDGWMPVAGVTVDQGGNLYGTTTNYTGPGAVFEMKNHNGLWVLTNLATLGNQVGIIPQGRPVIGPGGAIYGTTTEGGSGNCGEFACGTVYAIRPPQTICRTVSCPWTVSSVYSFTGDDGNYPYFVDPVFDAAGNIYGTTLQGGQNLLGNVFQLTRSGGGWTGASIHDFNGNDGLFPVSGVVLDAAGNVYGTVEGGGDYGQGAVFRLTHSGSGWTETSIYSFQNGADGNAPIGGLVFDAAGNLYGTSSSGGAGGGGTVFQLSPSGGGWNFTLLYSFAGGSGDGPWDSVSLDPAGNLYGTTYAEGAHGLGNIFKLTRNGNNWTYTSLHDFAGTDGSTPIGGVSMDSHGDLFGTTTMGGNGDYGVVWEITP